jgi:hypothetical protein
MRRTLRPALALLCLPAVADAEPWDCRFTVECAAAGGCAEAAFAVQVIAADHAGELFLTTLAGDSPVRRMTEAGALPASYASAGLRGLAELLTVEADRTAILTVHMFDEAAAAVTYFGTCEELP